VTALVHEDVRRFDIAVNETPLVCRVERVSDLLQQSQRALGLQRTLLGEQPLEIRAVDEAHGDVELPGDLARVVDRDDRRMVERCGQPRLAQEALAEPNVLGELGGKQLQRHVPVEREVARPVHDAHPTAAQQRLDPVARELGPWSKRRLTRRRTTREHVASRHAPPFQLKIRPSERGDQLAPRLPGGANELLSVDGDRSRLATAAAVVSRFSSRVYRPTPPGRRGSWTRPRAVGVGRRRATSVR